MSFEGYNEYITNKGRYLVCDVYDSICLDDLKENEYFQWFHSVDLTNGIEEIDPEHHTNPAEKEIIGFVTSEYHDLYDRVFVVISHYIYEPVRFWTELDKNGNFIK